MAIPLQTPVVRLLLLAAMAATPRARADEFSKLAASFGTTTVVAGRPEAVTTLPDGTAINFWDPSYEGGLAAEAFLSNPHNAGTDAFGNVYVADKASHSILKVTPDGNIHTWAGTHVPGFNGDGPAPGNTLQIAQPNGLRVQPDGTVYLLDPGNRRIRRVDPAGTMTTVFVDPEPQWASSGRALWVSPAGDRIYYAHELQTIPPGPATVGAVVKQWTPARGIEVLCDRTVGFRNPGNLDVNPVDGKLYVTDRAEEDPTKLECGVYRIDGPNLRTRLSGVPSDPNASSGRKLSKSFVDQPRGIAFLPDGAFFLCGHKDGNVWYVDTTGVLHQYIQGSGKGDGFGIVDGEHPPLTSANMMAQPRAVTLNADGSLVLVSNDSGYVTRVPSAAPAAFASQPRLLPGAGATLAWTGTPGRAYRVERAATLVPPAWQPVGAVAAAVPSGAAQWTDPAPPPASAWYRVVGVQ